MILQQKTSMLEDITNSIGSFSLVIKFELGSGLSPK